MATFNVDNSGNLVISITPEERNELKEQYPDDQINDERVFIDLIEYQLCNGYHLVNPENIGALTSSLLISDGILDEETTEEEANDTNVWYYNYYAIRSYIADLMEQGYVIWNRA
jgi:hypothetical protein